MPPGRRGRPAGSTNRTSASSSSSASNTASKTTPQQRLSFHPNATNKVTKPSPLGRDSGDGGKSKKAGKLSPKAKKALEDEIVVAETRRDGSHSPSPVQGVEEDEESTKLPIRRGQKVEVEVKEQEGDGRDEKDVAAGKVSEAQIRKFWQLKEESRIVGRVHQQGMSVHEKVLREWDMSTQYGSCIGISRTKRWKRADRLGLRPPLEVLAVLIKEEEKEGTKGGVQIAHMDKLMGGKGEETDA